MNLYRIRVRSQDGTISDHDIKAASVRLALGVSDKRSEILKVERIDLLTGEVLVRFYSSKWVESVA
jgi:hypothetical protein